MVQIIKERRPQSTSERFANAFTGLGQSLSQDIPQHMMERENKRLSEDRYQKENKAFQSLTGMDISDIRDEKMREKALELSLQGKNKESALKQKQDFLKTIFGGQENKGNGSNLSSESTSGLSEGNFDPSKITDAQIVQATALDPTIGRSLQQAKDVALREKREDTKSNERKVENLRKETLPIRKEISDRAESARRSIENKQKQIELIDSGKIDDPTYATLLEAIPMHLGQRFLSPETVEYKAGLVQGYGDLKNIFSGATRVKEVEILEKKIADLYLTDQQKKSILKSSIDTQKADIIREEAASELEGKPLSLLQYRKEVERIAKPKLDALFNKILDEQSAIIKDAENSKKLALDDSDPSDAQIIDQILQEAGGDWRKAEKLAKQKGYKF